MDFLKRRLNYLPGYYKDSPAPPQAPDPVKTANTQSEVSHVNQYTPFGSLTYQQTGTNPDGTGIYSQNVNLSPVGQGLLNQQLQQDQGLNNIASGMMGQVQGALNQPMLSSQDLMADKNNTVNAVYQGQTAMLDPRFNQQESQLTANLINQGITQGSDAWNNAMGNFSRDKNMAYQEAMDSAIQQGGQEQSRLFQMNQAARSEPLNELNALRSMGQVQMPQFGQVQTPNIAQLIQNQYQGQLNNYNQQIAQNNSMTSGLFGLGGSLGAAYLLA